MLDLPGILGRARDLTASTIHLRAGEAPVLRVTDRLVRLDMPPLADAELDAVARGMLSQEQLEEYEREGDVGFLYREGEVAFKANFFRLIDGHGLVLKRIASTHPSTDDLGLPTYLEDYLGLRTGLVLLTGPIGCGKTTTLNALLYRLNQERDLHVMTVEDPVEFVHADGRCLIQQCEVGQHVTSVSEGVDLARRLSPDILVVTELPDRATVDGVLTAAESALVLVTVHARSVTQAIMRLDGFFAPDEKTRFRARLGTTLRVAAGQVLVHRQYGTGMRPVFELLANTEEVTRAIAAGAYSNLPDIMERNRGLGMCPLDDALQELVAANLVQADEAIAHAFDAERFEVSRRRR